MNGRWCKFKKTKKYTNTVHPPLLTGHKNKKILELVNIPGLNILLGVVDKILKEIEKYIFENKECRLQFFNRYLARLELFCSHSMFFRTEKIKFKVLKGPVDHLNIKDVNKLDSY